MSLMLWLPQSMGVLVEGCVTGLARPVVEPVGEDGAPTVMDRALGVSSGSLQLTIMPLTGFGTWPGH